MNDADNKTLTAYLQLQLSKSIKTESRIDALTMMVTLLAKKAGMSDAEVNKLARHFEETAYQRRLEIAEDINPGLAAELDKRPPPDAIPPVS